MIREQRFYKQDFVAKQLNFDEIPNSRGLENSKIKRSQSPLQSLAYVSDVKALQDKNKEL